MTTLGRDLIVMGLVGGAALARRRSHVRDPRLEAALVTGGSRGLGLAIARELLARGYRVAICARDADTLERARRDLTTRGEVLAIQADVHDDADVARCVSEAEEAFGRIDVLVNAAATISVGPLETTSIADYVESMEVTLLGAVRCAFAVLPGMRARGVGRIVNVSSIGGRVAVPHLLPYDTAKFALTGFSEGLRAELAGTGIAVTTACLGLTRTGSARHVRFRGRPDVEHAWFAVADSLPLLSGDASRTARRVVDAAERGDAELVTTIPALAATLLHGLMPGLTADVLGLVNRWLLPSAQGQRREARGRDVGLPSRASVLTRGARRAAVDLNQIGPAGADGTPTYGIDAKKERAMSETSLDVNVGSGERTASLALGAGLVAAGLRRSNGPLRPLFLLAGGLLAWRGASGHSRLYRAAHIGTAPGARRPSGARAAITIGTSADELRGAFRDPEWLARVLPGLTAIRGLEGGKQDWTFGGAQSATVEMEMSGAADGLVWRATRVPSFELTVTFTPAPGDRGTEVRIEIEHPEAPGIAVLATWLGDLAAGQVLDRALRRAKQILETGDVQTAESSAGERSVAYRVWQKTQQAAGGES